MSRQKTLVIIGASATLALAAAARAHHSYTGFDRCTSYTIEGDIAAVEWINPHIVMSLKTADTTYRVEWFAPQRLTRFGLESGVLKTGDHVLMTGSRNRDPQIRMLALLTKISRPSDGWAWSRPQTEVCRPTDAATTP
jgi:hypothetical protein